jgi:selenide,water dikinase
MARGSNLTIKVNAADLPLLKEAERLAQEKFVTGASIRNWASYMDGAVLPDGLPDWRRHILTDPQTSGGLLIACEAASASALVEKIVAAGYPLARIIGRAEVGPARVEVTA